MTEGYGLPEGEDTGRREISIAHARVEAAEQGAMRTQDVLDRLTRAVSNTRRLHVENGYVPKLRAIFRESM